VMLVSQIMLPSQDLGNGRYKYKLVVLITLFFVGFYCYKLFSTKNPLNFFV
jgi:hypothetical protein